MTWSQEHADETYGCPDARRLNSGTQEPGQDVLNFVGFIEDNDVVYRQDITVGREMSSVESGVDDDDVSRGGPLFGQFGETLVAVLALHLANALLGIHRDGTPGSFIDLKGQLIALAALGLLGPVHNATDLVDHGGGYFFDFVKRALIARRSHLFGLLQAEVVTPPLQDGRAEPVGPGGDQWGILFSELILEILGRRGNDDSSSRDGDRGQVGQ